MINSLAVQWYIDHPYYRAVQIYTDGSRDPDTGHTEASVFIPQFRVKIIKENLRSFSSVLIAISLALQWLEEVEPVRSAICTDSISAWSSLSGGKHLLQDKTWLTKDCKFFLEQVSMTNS